MTDKPDLDHLRQWIGRTEKASDIVTAQLVRGLRATLFHGDRQPKPGDAAPFTTHWCLAQPVFPMSELSPDGHPDSRRLPAAGAAAAPDVGRRRTGIHRHAARRRRGDAHFAHIGRDDEDRQHRHIVFRLGRACDHDTARNRDPRAPGHRLSRHIGRAASRARQAAAAAACRKTSRKPHGRSRAAVSLFGADLQRPPHPLRPRLRHQGRGLSRPDLPRPAAGGFLVELAAHLHGGKAPKKFSYRGVQPLFEGSEFSVNANDTDGGMELWTANSAGQPTMKGTATW